MTAKSGQIYRSRHGHHVKVYQVRETGRIAGRAGGLRYALLRPCGPGGRVHSHPVLGEDYVTAYLTPDGEMPPGYERSEGK